MKKIIAVLLLVCSLLTLCACGAKKQDASSANKLVYGEKYIKASDVSLKEAEQKYYVFEKDYLTFYCYDETYDGRVHYTITYKYEIMDEGTLAYFFDSIEIYDDDDVTKEREKNMDRGILLFSQNVLSTQSGTFYVRESYLEDELENFGKKD